MRAGTLVVDIAANVARLQTDMASAKGIVAGAMSDITKSVNVAKTALGALGVGLSVGALAGMAANIIRATAALDDMAEVTGAAVEELSKLQVVAKIGGHDFGLVEDSLVKLTKGLKGNAEETKNAANALGILGVKAKDATGNLRDPGELMREVAGKLAQFQDGAGKTAIALDLFGKSGAKLLPFLKDMAEEGTIAARVTAQQAAEAEKLEKNLNRLKIAGEDAKREFVLANTGWMVDFTEKLIDAQKAAGNLATALLLVAAGGKSVEQVNAEIAALEGKSSIRRWFENGISMGMGGVADAGQLSVLYRQRDYLKIQQDRRMGTLATGMVDDLSGTWQPAPAKPKLDYKGAPDKATGKTLADLLAETSGIDKDFYKDLQTLHAGYTGGVITLDRYRVAVENLIEKQKFSKDLTKSQTDALKSLTETARLKAEEDDKQNEILAQFNTTASQRLQQLEFETSLIEDGAAAQQRALLPRQEAMKLEAELTAVREKAIAFRQIDLQLERDMVAATPETVDALYERADAEKARLGAAIDARASRQLARDSAQATADEWKQSQVQMWQSIDSTAHDTFVSIFHSGKDAFDRLRDTLKNGLYDLLYQITIKRWIVNISAMVSGGGVSQSAFGGSGGAAGGLGFNPLSMANSANSLLSSGGNLWGTGMGQAAMGVGNSLGIGMGYNAAAVGGSMGVAELGLIAGAEGAMGTGAVAAAGMAEMGGAAMAGAMAAEAGAGAAGMMAAGSMAGPIGLAIAAIAMLAMSGDSGGPKPSELWVRDNGGAALSLEPINVNGAGNVEAGNPAYAQAAAQLNALPEEFRRQLVGQHVTTEPSDNAGSMIQALMSQSGVQSVMQAAQVKAQQKQTASVLMEAKDPNAYWRGQMGELQGSTGSTASTIEQWRDEFIKALDAPLTQDQFANWQKLGQAIEEVGRIAGTAADAISTSQFSTLVDYRRAVRLAGGVPKFAGGGLHEGGLALVGEMGPELINTGPARIYSNSETRGMFDTSRLEERLVRLESVMTSVAVASGRMANLFKRWDGDGLPEERAVV